MEIKLVKPEPHHLPVLAASMREADVAEIWASNHHTPLQSLTEGFKRSTVSTVITAHDVPIAMLGVVRKDVLSGTGWVWMLGTDGVVTHRHSLTRIMPRVIAEMLHVCPRLCNMVHVKNKVSVAWLKRSGFTLDAPVKYGPEGEMFHHFHLEKK